MYEEIERLVNEILAFTAGGKNCNTHWDGAEFTAVRDGKGVTIRGPAKPFWISEDAIERVLAEAKALQKAGIEERPKNMTPPASYVLGIISTMRGIEPVAVKKRRLVAEAKTRRDFGFVLEDAPRSESAVDEAEVKADG